jgi:hypothetical protein
MLLKAGDVCSRVATLMDDPGQTVFDEAYVKPFLNQVWDDCSVELLALGMDYQEDVQVLNPVAALTTDLSTFQAAGQPLETMIVPTFMEWKIVGDDDINYVEVPKRSRVPDVGAGTRGIAGYEWRKNVVYISPSAVDTVVRVRFKAYSVDFADPTDSIMAGASNILAYATAELIDSPGVRNGNQGKAFIYWGQKKRESIDNFAVLLTKAKQGIRYRLGSNSGRARRRSRIVLRAGS